MLHGHEAARLVRFESGEVIEVHKPLSDQERWLRVNYQAHAPLVIEPGEDARGVRRKGYAADKRWQALSRFFYEDRIEPVTPAQIADTHGAHTAVEQSDDAPQIGH